jgi:hypothetical protein
MADIKFQTIDTTVHDTLIFLPGKQLQQTPIFNEAGKPEWLNNLRLPVQQDHTYRLSSARLVNNVLVRPTNEADPDPALAATEQQILRWQQEFQNSSSIFYQIQTIAYPEILLSQLLPYTIELVGTKYQVNWKPQNQGHRFMEDLKIEQGSVYFYFKPAAGYSLLGDPFAYRTPIMDHKITDPAGKGYAMQLFMRGVLDRPIAEYTR